MPFDAEGFIAEPSLRPLPEPITKTNLRKVRDFIAALPPEKFDMGSPYPEASECGTAACIGGWGRLVLGDLPVTLLTFGEEAFGLTAHQAGALFYPNYVGDFSPMLEATPSHAVRVLDHLIETGEVDWSKALDQ